MIIDERGKQVRECMKEPFLWFTIRLNEQSWEKRRKITSEESYKKIQYHQHWWSVGFVTSVELSTDKKRDSEEAYHDLFEE